MFEIATVVDGGVPDQDWNDPPKEHTLKALRGAAKDGQKGDPMKNLDNSRSLKVLHDSTFLREVKVSQAPASSTVVDWNASGGIEDTAQAALEGVGNVQELANITYAIQWDVSKGLVL